MIAADLIAETRRLLQGSARDEVNVLAGAHSANAPILNLTLDLGGVTKGALLSVDIETYYVTSAGGSTAAVLPGWAGSQTAAHDGGTVVLVNPHYTDHDIFAALNTELVALSSPANGLYQTVTFDFAATVANGYELPLTNFLEILDVRWQGYGPLHLWPQIRSYNVEQSANTTAFPSGWALFLYEDVAPGRTIHVTYKAEFTALADQNADLAATGLPTTCWDIPPLGAAARLLAAREARRSAYDTQPEPRTATEVPPGAARTGAAGLLSMRQTRVKEEADRLKQRHPTMKRIA